MNHLRNIIKTNRVPINRRRPMIVVTWIEIESIILCFVEADPLWSADFYFFVVLLVCCVRRSFVQRPMSHTMFPMLTAYDYIIGIENIHLISISKWKLISVVILSSLCMTQPWTETTWHRKRTEPSIFLEQANSDDFDFMSQRSELPPKSSRRRQRVSLS